MASERAVATGLAMMHECFPTREITPATAKAFGLLFEDTPDTDFLKACKVLCRENGRTFFPSPGEIFAVLAPAPASYDIDSLCATIHDLGSYDPIRGWCYPSIQTLREKLGDAVADAYALAGGSAQVFANADSDGRSVGRDIARRTLAKELAKPAPLSIQNRPVLTPGSPQIDDRRLEAPREPSTANGDWRAILAEKGRLR